MFENDYWLKSYIREGILNGFKIVDDIDAINSYDRLNYASATVGGAGDFDLIDQEIASGKYIAVPSRPKCIHSMGSVKKSGGVLDP